MDQEQKAFDVIILGGGAAGLMCAQQAGRRGRRVVVVDRAKRLGTKILLSGGGKCNFTNRQCSAENYISSNPHFCKSALAQFGPGDFLDLAGQYHIAYEERDHGQLFYRRSAEDIVQMLIELCRQHQVNFLLECAVHSITKEKQFIITTNQGTITAESLVVATGGLSYPQTGAGDLGYQVARQFGLAVTPCQPGLVPLLYHPVKQSILAELTGISVEAAVTCRNKAFRENILFTHTGLSGPAILQISNYWLPGNTITIDWLPEIDVYQLLLDRKQTSGSAAIPGILSHCLPSRLVRLWSQPFFPEIPLAQCTIPQLRRAADSINRWPFQPGGTEGYAKAEVTLGGIDTGELSSKTLEAKRVKGLYFIGEVLDVTGQLGGYNLQWAWSSGYAAGCAV